MAKKKRRKKRKRKKKRVHKTDMDRIQQKADEIATSFFKASQGKNVLRILPPWGPQAQGQFFFEYALHYGFQVRGQGRAFPCLTAVGWNDECPICKAIQLFQKRGASDLARRIAPRDKYYVNALDRRRERVYIWGMSRKMLREILGYMNDPEWGDITDPEEGHDIVLEREGTGLKTSYTLRMRPRPKPIGFPGWQEAMFQLHKEIPEPISFDELKKILLDNYGEALEAAVKPPESELIPEEEEEEFEEDWEEEFEEDWEEEFEEEEEEEEEDIDDILDQL